MTNETAKLIEDQLALCAVALKECLDSASNARGHKLFGRVKSELDSATALLHASARLGASLVRLRGDSRHTIRVERARGEGTKRPGEGSIGKNS